MNVRFPAAGRTAIFGFAMLLLAACASHPRPLQGEFAQISPYDALNTDSTGAMVRWGGRIVHTDPLPNQTCFEVHFCPFVNPVVKFSSRRIQCKDS